MEGDADDTVIDYVEPLPGPFEALTKQRRVFVRLRWILYVVLGCLVISAVTLLTLEYKWWALLCAMLSLAIVGMLTEFHSLRFCPDCQYWLPVTTPIPSTCPNCGRLLDAREMLIDPPGLLNLSDERYRNDGKPCVKLLAMVILLGIKDRSTEVRFEPGREEFQLRYRCGGVLYDMVPPPLFLHKTITGLLKAMAGLHPDRRAQAGTMQIKVDHATIDARMETQPTEFGENVIVWFQDIYDVHDEAEALLQRFCRKADGNGLPLGEPST